MARKSAHLQLIFGLAFLAGCAQPAPPVSVHPTKASTSAKLLSLPKFTPKAITNVLVTLAWNASAGATGYRIYQGAASLAYTVTNDVGNTLTGMMQAAPGRTNYFAVTAYNQALESGYSSEAIFVAPFTPLPPTNLVIVSVTLQGSVDLKQWTNVASANLLALTNPPFPLMTYRGLLGITQTNQ